jgi:hypothetical protein
MRAGKATHTAVGEFGALDSQNAIFIAVASAEKAVLELFNPPLLAQSWILGSRREERSEFVLPALYGHQKDFRRISMHGNKLTTCPPVESAQNALHF